MNSLAVPPVDRGGMATANRDHQGSTDANGQATVGTYASPMWPPPRSAPGPPSASAPHRLTSEAPHRGMQMQAEAQAEGEEPQPLSSVRQWATANRSHRQAATGAGVVDAQPEQTPTGDATTAPIRWQPTQRQKYENAAQASSITSTARNDTLVSRSRKTRAVSRVRPSRPPRECLHHSSTPSCASCASPRCSSSRSPSMSRSKPRCYVPASSSYKSHQPYALYKLPNEIILHILGFLDVNDLLATSRTSHQLRCLCVAPILHIHRMRYIRAALPPLLAAPQRPSLTELIQRSIFLTNTTVLSRKLARSLVTIKLSHRLAVRPPVHVLVERCVLPPECAPGIGHVAPALAARTRAIEREKLKDGLRNWIGAVWKREVGRRSERMRRNDEKAGVGKVWRLRKFWERVSHSSA